MNGLAEVKIPKELNTAPQRPLEDYVRTRILQFAPLFASKIDANVTDNDLHQAAVDVIQALPSPKYDVDANNSSRQLMLVFRHDCLSLGCLDPQCALCEHNPHRRCSVNFAHKYLVNDVLKAKCDAAIRVEVIDATGAPVREDIPGLSSLEVFVVDGNQYDQKCLEAGDTANEDSSLADNCALLLNNKATPLIVSGTGATHNSDNRIVLPVVKGVATLPELQITDSSEALLSGRKPPFRLVVRASGSGASGGVRVRTAVSEGFVVATRRTRTAGKVEIPNVDDHISKLEHMGKETVKKLQDISGSAKACGVEILQVPDNCINKVGEFRKLALLAEADGHLRQKLQQVLKLSKEKWDEARDHAMRAVVADNRMRIWYADQNSMEMGLLFTCRLGKIDIERPAALLTKKAQEGAGTQTLMEATLMAQQTPAQREQVRVLQPQAENSWWSAGHPGWAIHPIDSDQFLATGALDVVSVPTTDSLLPIPGSPQMAGLTAFNPALASAFMAGVPNDVFLRAMSPFMGPAGSPFLPPGMIPGVGGLPPGAIAAAGVGGPEDEKNNNATLTPSTPPPTSTTTVGGIGQQQQQQQQGMAIGPDGGGVEPGPSTGGTTPSPAASSSPFANHIPQPATRANSQGLANTALGFRLASMAGGGGPNKTASMDGMPSFTIGNLQAMLGPDFAKFPLNLPGFPSLPAGSMLGSGDLEQLLGGQFGGGGDPAARLPSLNIGKVSSLELPEAPALDLTIKPEHMDMAMFGKKDAKKDVLQRRNSGLESMQSIEVALQTVKTADREARTNNDIKSAMDAAVNAEKGPATAVGTGRRRRLTGTKRK